MINGGKTSGRGKGKSATQAKTEAAGQAGLPIEAKTERKAVTIHDVALAAGVTAATVSRTLSGKRHGSEGVRAAVLSAVEKLGYQPNAHAQNLANGRADKHIDLLSLHLDFGIDARKAQLIQGLLLARGFNAPLHAYGWGATETFEQHELMSQLCRARPRAIACDLSGMNSRAVAELERFGAQGGLVTCWGYGQEPIKLKCPQVLFNSRYSLQLATQHLVELGHTRIGVAFPTYSSALNNRSAQFSHFMEEAGLEARPDWVFLGVPRAAGTEVEEAGEQIAAWFLSLSERPDALVIPNDYAALRFINELHHAGLRVPRDVSLVAHDDRPLARTAPVPLSSITHPADQIARGVIELLEAGLRGEIGETETPRHIVVRGELRARQSSAAPG